MKETFINTSDNIKIALNHHISGYSNVVIIAPGWFMTKDSKPLKNLANILAENFDVISFDFRGHGKSSGFYTFTSRETRDLKTVVNYAKDFYEKVYLIGFSLGGALVIIHATLEKNIDKIIVVSAPTDFDKIENQMWRKEAFIPTFQKFELKRWLSVRPSIIIRKKIKPIDVVDKIEVPTLFVAGENDPTVFAWHTKSLFEKAHCKKKFEFFKNCNHAEDLFIDEPEKFVSMCVNWLTEN